jgi:hypothetical protein
LVNVRGTRKWLAAEYARDDERGSDSGICGGSKVIRSRHDDAVSLAIEIPAGMCCLLMRAAVLMRHGRPPRSIWDPILVWVAHPRSTTRRL